MFACTSLSCLWGQLDDKKHSKFHHANRALSTSVHFFKLLIHEHQKVACCHPHWKQFRVYRPVQGHSKQLDILRFELPTPSTIDSRPAPSAEPHRPAAAAAAEVKLNSSQVRFSWCEGQRWGQGTAGFS